MCLRRLWSVLLAAIAVPIAVLAYAQSTQEVSATIDGTTIGEPITKYIYGQFIEHLGDLINKGLWAEMLDDRKFFYSIPAKGDEPRPASPRRTLRRWMPIGPDDSVSMDRENRYCGNQSPRIEAAASAPRGIQQSGLALRKGKAYTGRIIVSADPGVKVNVSLIWGPNAVDRETVSVGPLRRDFAKFALHFTSGLDTEDGRIEIAGTGRGPFRIGAVSLMPADNVSGFRADTTRLLKQLNSGFYRLPGGNFVSGYDWKDAIGDLDKRPPKWDYAWSAVQPNDVGMDEFMTLCRLLGVEPYVTVNAGFGEARSAAELVEYANGLPDSPMGHLRAANGHPQPYNVKFWNVGNEPYGRWQLGHMALNQYTIKHNLFAQAMRRRDPRITILASGAMIDEMTVTVSARYITGKVIAEFGSQADWTGGLLARSSDFFDGLTEHWYCYSGKRFDLDAGQNKPFGNQTGYVQIQEPLVDWARRPANRVRLKAEDWDEYKKRFPVIANKKIFVSIDEWAYPGTGPNMKLSLSLAWALQEMFRHTDFIKMASYTFAVTCIDWNATDAALNTTGMMFKLYRDHFGTLPLKVNGNSPQPPPKWPVGGDQPKVNAGSDTYPLDIAAALTADRISLTVAIVNPTETLEHLDLSFKSLQLKPEARLWRMSGPNAEASNRLGQPPQVSVAESAVTGLPGQLEIPAASISIYRFDTR